MSTPDAGKGLGFARGSLAPGSGSLLKLDGMAGWRGLGALIVVTFHLWQNMGDTTGTGPWHNNHVVFGVFVNVNLTVDMFFVLSGLLLFLPFANAALTPGVAAPNGRTFLYRRALRLFPVYWFVVVVVWSTRNFGFATAQWRDLFEHLLLVQSLDSQRIFYTIGPAWTLSVEWMFYLSVAILAPPLVRFVCRASGLRVRLVLLLTPLLAIAAASVAFKYAVQCIWKIPMDSWAWRFGPAAKADEFVLGARVAVAIVLTRGRKFPVTITLPIFAAGGLLISRVVVNPYVFPATWLLVGRHPIAAVGFGLLFFGVVTSRWRLPAALLDSKPMARIAILTFTIYIVHEPVLLWLIKWGVISKNPSWFLPNLVIFGAITMAVAWVVHRLVEEPWTDAAALQFRGGGRRELYPDLAPTTGSMLPVAPVTPPADPGVGGLRDRVVGTIPGIGGGPALTTGRRIKAAVPVA